MRLLLKPALSPRVPLRLQRAVTAALGRATWPVRGTVRTSVDLNGVPALEITPKAAIGDGVILYLHGGGYVWGGTDSHAGLAAHIGRASGAKVVLPLYRLAPEDPYPAAVEDATAAYRWLLDRGHSPGCIAVAGDSAGGGLTVAALVAIRDAGLPMPGAAALLSPWADLGLSGDSMVSRAGRDPVLTPAWLGFCAQAYCAGRPAGDPGCSPLFADLRGLPPLLIQVGGEEILCSDSERLTERARVAGVDVTLACYRDLWHVFQAFAGWLREADAAIAEIGMFFRQRWDTTSTAAQPEAPTPRASFAAESRRRALP